MGLCLICQWLLCIIFPKHFSFIPVNYTGCVSESGDFATFFFWFCKTGADAAIALLLPTLKGFSCNGAVDWSTTCCHTARDSMAAVRNLFPNHVISRYGDITWVTRSPDLSACDFFLWGYLKSQVFKAPAPNTVQELKH